MAKEMSATLSTDVIRAAAGERVNIGALFNQPVYIAIYEVGEVQGWKCTGNFDGHPQGPLPKVIREGLSEELTFELRPEG